MDLVLLKTGYQNFITRLAYFGLKLPSLFDTKTYFTFCKKSQIDKVFWHLENYGNITNMQCHEIYGIRHAPSVIKKLRARLKFQGNHYKIENNKKDGADRWGNPCIWIEYTLLPTEENQMLA